MKRKASILITSTVLASLILTGCKEEQADHKAQVTLPTVKVKTTVVTSQTAPLQIEFMGTVQAIHSAVIATKVSGNITEMPIELGDKVSKGQTLLKIDAGELSAKLQQAQAQLKQAKRNLIREQNLLKKKAATKEAVKAQQDMVNIAEASLKEAQTMLEYTHITSPFEGLVTRKLVNRGDLVTPGRPLIQVDNDKQLQVITNLPESILSSISIGQNLEISIPSIQAIVTGKVHELAPTADPVSRTALMKLKVPETDGLRPGQFARIQITRETELTTMIPKNALFPVGQLDRVFIVEDNKAKLRLVRTGTNYQDSVEILSGLSAGEKIITNTNVPLVDNQPITIQ